MTNFTRMTATVNRSGEPLYPSHVRVKAAYSMLMNAVWHVKATDLEAEHILRDAARKIAVRVGAGFRSKPSIIRTVCP